MSTLITNNKLTLDQQSADSTTLAWTGNNQGQATRDVAVYNSDPASIKITPTTTSGFASMTTGYGNVTGLIPGSIVQFTMQVRATVARTQTLLINWVKTDGSASTGAQVNVGIGTSAVGSWTLLSSNYLFVPTDATRAEIVVGASGITATSEITNYDDLYFGPPQSGSTSLVHTFTGADSTTTVPAANTGQAAVQQQGTWGISSNRLYVPSTGDGGRIYWQVNSNKGYAEFTVEAPTAGKYPRLMVRATPSTGACYWLEANPGNYLEVTRTDGGSTSVQINTSGGTGFVAGDRIGLEVVEAVDPADSVTKVRVRMFKNGAVLTTNYDTSTTVPTTGTYVGLRNGTTSSSITPFYDNLSYVDYSAAQVSATANAGADQTVAAGSTVTLVGTPPGGTWTQDSGTAVTLSAPVTNATDTRVTFTADNASTTSSIDRVFRYTV